MPPANDAPGSAPVERFSIREAAVADCENLARLHVATFIETHGGPGPSFATRNSQWQDFFAQHDPAVFCFVAESGAGDLVGFAKGVPYRDELTGYAGELNKIYVLRRYHRRGVGRLLLGHVARRFLARKIHSMLLFGDARNPSNGFYEHLGAERLYAESGDFHGGYGWRNLDLLAARCPLPDR